MGSNRDQFRHTTFPGTKRPRMDHYLDPSQHGLKTAFRHPQEESSENDHVVVAHGFAVSNGRRVLLRLPRKVWNYSARNRLCVNLLQIKVPLIDVRLVDVRSRMKSLTYCGLQMEIKYRFYFLRDYLSLVFMRHGPSY
jgi:hypothetical protein